MAWARPRAEIRPLQQAVGAVAGGHPGVAPTRQPSHQGAVVGRRRAQPDPGLEVVGAVEPRRHGQAFAQELVQARPR